MNRCPLFILENKTSQTKGNITVFLCIVDLAVAFFWTAMGASWTTHSLFPRANFWPVPTYPDIKFGM